MTINRSKIRKMARGGQRSRRTTKTVKSKQPMPRAEEVMEYRVNPSLQELGVLVEKSARLLETEGNAGQLPFDPVQPFERSCESKLNTVFKYLRGMTLGGR